MFKENSKKKINQNNNSLEKDNNSISFPIGIYGFEEHTEFTISIAYENSIFYSLQSVKDKNLSFLIVNPRILLPDYLPKIYENHLEPIGKPNIKYIEIWVLVTIPADNPEKMTVNLQGPILINKKNNLGMQIISEDDTHSLKYSIFQHLKKLSKFKI